MVTGPSRRRGATGERRIQYADLSVEEFRKQARLHVEALNHALAAIPPERARIKPLACGGPDAVSNLQWQTIAAARAKDRWERKVCAQ
jgi:hypothetical protein